MLFMIFCSSLVDLYFAENIDFLNINTFITW